MRADVDADGWTVGTLKAYVEQRFIDQEKAVSAALAAAEKAVSAALVAAERAREQAETNAEKWRQNANEWRAAMMDREQKFASRPEVQAEFKAVGAAVQSLKESRAEGLGSKAVWAALVSLALVLIGVAGLVLRFGKP